MRILSTRTHQTSEFMLEDGKIVIDEIPSNKIPSNINIIKDGKITRINDLETADTRTSMGPGYIYIPEDIAEFPDPVDSKQETRPDFLV